jgi:DNA topoisomerase-2
MTKSTVKYNKLTQREHVLVRPDTYIGSVELTEEDHWIYDDENNKMLKKKIKFTPGFLKVFDEILVNAADASQNDKTCDTIKVEYNKEEGYISVWNNGDNGIPIEMHEEHKVLIPSMIFGELLTSSNYDDTVERTTGGRNGVGSKATNIFSTRFIVEIGDAKNKKKFVQEWTENMLVVGKAKVTDNKTIKNYIKVTFYPDCKKFGIENLDNDHFGLFYRRTYDLAGINDNKLKVFFNDKKIETNNFKSYINLYYPDDDIYLDESNERWKLGVIYKPDEGNNIISFVNNINTYHGGTHVNHVVDNIIKVLINDHIKKKEKDIKISPQNIKDNMVFFINSVIVNPSFSAQTKENCTTKVEKFGSKYNPQVAFLKKLAKCGIVEQIIELAKFKESSTLKKTDGKKQVKLRGIPKLDDANKAGTKDSYKCSLILTEGDSAKAFAMAGLSIIGRDYFGVFPLKGKLLNVREASPQQLLNNEEINNLKQIIGLKHGEDYSDDTKFNQLRYGRIVALTDSDVDGSHIKGLLMNFVHSIWPSLIKRPNFITTLATPIVKAFKGQQVMTFYNLTEYDDWVKNNDTNNWKIKYYKGLGTSTSSEAKEYFVDFEQKLIGYNWEEKEEDEEKENKVYVKENDDEDALLLAFEKSRADDRKLWLQEYDKNNILSYENKNVRYHEFIHSDLIHFSNDDLSRSIPSLLDGFKPSQRKILYGAILRGLDKDEVKVAQLAGFVSDKAAYHHGEASLQGAIIGMAQDFVGSNNINILKPQGNFGSRLRGGKDAASPRYIWTKFEDLTSTIFNSNDIPILNQQFEDNDPIEPEYYAPIIPMVLINGAEGIGTGFSTKIPPYNPKDIISNIKRRLNGEEMINIDPWWAGFEGQIAKIDNSNYEIYGTWSINNNKLIISELPIGEWTSNYKEFLEKLLNPDNEPKKEKQPKGKVTKKVTKKENTFIGYTENNTDTKVHFELEFEPGYLQTATDIDKIFHLCKKYSITNMHLFDPSGRIKKYNNILEIIEEYYILRLNLYQKRKDYQLGILEHQLKLISYKVKFILLIVDKKLDINNKKKSEIEENLEKLKFPKLGKSKDDDDKTYNYLLSMPLYSLSKEKIDELKKQENDKQTEYDDLEKLSPQEIWTYELEKLETLYDKWFNNKNTKDQVKPKKGKKK